MEFENIPPELLEKAKAIKTAEELIALAEQEGYELSDAELEQVAGGSWSECYRDCLMEGNPFE